MSAAAIDTKKARLDTGAEAILLRKSTVDSQGLISTQASNTEIIFGNGHSTVTDKKTTIGDVEALICEDGILQEDLLSGNPLLDIGFKLTMNKASGLLHNEETGASIHVQREGKRWAVDLEVRCWLAGVFVFLRAWRAVSMKRGIFTSCIIMCHV